MGLPDWGTKHIDSVISRNLLHNRRSAHVDDHRTRPRAQHLVDGQRERIFLAHGGAVAVDERQAIGVGVGREAEVGPFGTDPPGEILQIFRTGFRVAEEISVRLAVDLHVVTPSSSRSRGAITLPAPLMQSSTTLNPRFRILSASIASSARMARI